MLTAWSSLGTLELVGWIAGFEGSVWRLVPMVFTPDALTLLGSMLPAVGLGASLARRRR